MRRWYVLAAVAALTTGCVLLSDLSGLTGGDAPDASPGGDATADALSDAPDVQGDGDADPSFVDAAFCVNSDATFCDDFDTTDPLSSLWSDVSATFGGVIAKDRSDAALSAPNTLLSRIPETPDAAVAAQRVAVVRKALKGPFTHVELALSILVEVADPISARSVLAVQIVANDDDAGVAEHELYFNLSGSDVGMTALFAGGNAKFSDGGNAAQGFPQLLHAPVPGKWSRLTIAIDSNPDGGPSALVVTLDGAIVLNDMLAAGWTFGNTTSFNIGAFFPYLSLATWQLRYDNVELRTR